jgi:hypothetical protein
MNIRAIASKSGMIFDSKQINRLQIPLQKQALISSLLHFQKQALISSLLHFQKQALISSLLHYVTI